MRITSMVAAGMVLALLACESRPADRGDQVESGADPGAAGAVGSDTTTAPPGYSGMEQDTSGTGGTAGTGETDKMDSFRLKQETGSDTGGHSGGEQMSPSGGDTTQQ